VEKSLAASEWPEIVWRVRAQTPARVLVGRAGSGYPTNTQIELREAHAAARDAVRTELNLVRDLGAELLEKWGLFEVSTCAASKDEYLLRPDLGRCFSDKSRSEIAERCKRGCDLQIAIGDGLSVTAVAAQVPELLGQLADQGRERGLSFGQPFAIRHCRVGILNEIGELLAPSVAVLLIGERPGLATAKSLSAYMAYRPQKNHTDANRNLISNIHGRGVSTKEAATRIIRLAAQMMMTGLSGFGLREELAALGEG
jgi:ethanolamine ammonia-lyase small subunit